MGFDLYIEARIREKSTDRIISDIDSYYDEEDKGFFTVCEWNSRMFYDVRDRFIVISNKYAKTNYTNEDFTVYFPDTALNEMYEYLLSRSRVSEGEFEIDDKEKWLYISIYEEINLSNALKLHELMYTLKSIKYNNIYTKSFKEHISDENDLKFFEKNPQAYEWEFRIFNSY